jgi:acetyl-CoA carboxylase carboxyl transferase subunit alpha
MKINPLEFEKPIVELEKQLDELKKHSKLSSTELEREVRAMEKKIEETKREIYEMLTPWQKVQIARHTARPFALDYLKLGFSDFVELHGDRLFGNDEAMPCGFATIGEYRCVVVAHADIRGSYRRRRIGGSVRNRGG